MASAESSKRFAVVLHIWRLSRGPSAPGGGTAHVTAPFAGAEDSAPSATCSVPRQNAEGRVKECMMAKSTSIFYKNTRGEISIRRIWTRSALRQTRPSPLVYSHNPSLPKEPPTPMQGDAQTCRPHGDARLVCSDPPRLSNTGCRLSVLQKCGRAIGACLHAKVRLLSAEDGEQK